MIAAWGSSAAMFTGVALILPWAFGNNSTRSWRAAGAGMFMLAAGLVALVVIGIAIT